MATAQERRRHRLDSLRSMTSSTQASSGARPPSPTFSTTTVGSKPPDSASGLLITRADLREALRCYEDMMVASKNYRQALISKARATAELASSMEACSRLKGADHSGPGLQASAGFYFVLSNGENVLADSFYKNFEIPLLHSLDTYRQDTVDRQLSYEHLLIAKTKIIRETEASNLKLSRSSKKGKGPGRDLASFRRTLEMLQNQVDELDRIKGEYYAEVEEAEDELWEGILEKIGAVLKTQLEIYDRISSKATDPVLEPLLSSHPDPFEVYAPTETDSAAPGPLFSILPPIGLPSSIASSSKTSPSHALRTSSTTSLSRSNSSNPTNRTSAAAETATTVNLCSNTSPRPSPPSRGSDGSVSGSPRIDSRDTVENHSTPPPTSSSSSSSLHKRSSQSNELMTPTRPANTPTLSTNGNGLNGRSRSVTLEGPDDGDDEDGFLSPRHERSSFGFSRPSGGPTLASMTTHVSDDSTEHERPDLLRLGSSASSTSSLVSDSSSTTSLASSTTATVADNRPPTTVISSSSTDSTTTKSGLLASLQLPLNLDDQSSSRSSSPFPTTTRGVGTDENGRERRGGGRVLSVIEDEEQLGGDDDGKVGDEEEEDDEVAVEEEEGMKIPSRTEVEDDDSSTIHGRSEFRPEGLVSRGDGDVERVQEVRVDGVDNAETGEGEKGINDVVGAGETEELTVVTSEGRSDDGIVATEEDTADPEVGSHQDIIIATESSGHSTGTTSGSEVWG